MCNNSDPFGLCPQNAGGDGKTDTFTDCMDGSSGYYANRAAQGHGGVLNTILGWGASCGESGACESLAGALGAIGGSAAIAEVASLFAEGAEAAGEAEALSVEANKLLHIFGKASHNLGGLVEHFGSEEAAFGAVQKATQGVKGLSGIFETTVKVGGQNVTVTGRVIKGIARIGTFFIP